MRSNDFIEFVAEYGPEKQREKFQETANSYLARENLAYRIVDGVVTEITSAEEIAEVEDALSASVARPTVRAHLQAALRLMSDKKSPDFRNSIKESISAVEALARRLSGDDSSTLGAILKSMEKAKRLHPALKSAFSTMATSTPTFLF